MPTWGWLMLGLGIFFTLLGGFGLMALVFRHESRSGTRGGSGASSWRPKSITSSRIEATGDYSLLERTSSRCAGAAMRKRLRGRFSARDQGRTNTACRSIPITTGTRRTERPSERGHPAFAGEV